MWDFFVNFFLHTWAPPSKHPCEENSEEFESNQLQKSKNLNLIIHIMHSRAGREPPKLTTKVMYGVLVLTLVCYSTCKCTSMLKSPWMVENTQVLPAVTSLLQVLDVTGRYILHAWTYSRIVWHEMLWMCTMYMFSTACTMNGLATRAFTCTQVQKSKRTTRLLTAPGLIERVPEYPAHPFHPYWKPNA